MKALKWTSLMLMLLAAASATAQEEFLDDVYFSSKNKKNKVQKVEEKKVEQPQLRSTYQVLPAESQVATQGVSAVSDRDVDEYNRR